VGSTARLLFSADGSVNPFLHIVICAFRAEFVPAGFTVLSAVWTGPSHHGIGRYGFPMWAAQFQRVLAAPRRSGLPLLRVRPVPWRGQDARARHRGVTPLAVSNAPRSSGPRHPPSHAGLVAGDVYPHMLNLMEFDSVTQRGPGRQPNSSMCKSPGRKASQRPCPTRIDRMISPLTP
jgi:hypothetical protein